MKDWVLPTTKQHWEKEDWEKRFRGHHKYLERIMSSDWTLPTKLPVGEWIAKSDSNNRYLNEVSTAFVHGQDQRVEKTAKTCDHCGEEELHAPPAEGEKLRGCTCSSCGEWYTVYDRR